MKKIHLWLFDGEGTAPAEGTGEVQGTDNDDLANQNVVYGKQPEVSEPQDDKPALDYNSFKEQFKDEYQQDLQRVIDKRFKNAKKVEAQRDELQGKLGALSDILGSRYGTDNYDDLLKAVEADRSYIEQQALEKGVSAEAYEAQLKAERLNKELERKNAAEEDAKKVQQWQNEAEQLKELYPEFELADEIDNEKFAFGLQCGMSVRDAYQHAHFDDILSGVIKYTAQSVKQGVAKAKATRQARPAENGTRTSAASVVKNDVKNLTNKDMDEIDRLVMRGEKISFG